MVEPTSCLVVYHAAVVQGNSFEVALVVFRDCLGDNAFGWCRKRNKTLGYQTRVTVQELDTETNKSWRHSHLHGLAFSSTSWNVSSWAWCSIIVFRVLVASLAACLLN